MSNNGIYINHRCEKSVAAHCSIVFEKQNTGYAWSVKRRYHVSGCSEMVVEEINRILYCPFCGRELKYLTPDAIEELRRLKENDTR